MWLANDFSIVFRCVFYRFQASIPSYRLTPHGGAVQADGITSANTVGYSGATINADQWYMVGVQFADVGSATEVADFNSLLSITCTPGEIGDGSDPTWGNAPMIQVLKANGQSYAYYYYVSDGDDGTMRFDLTGWVDELGNLVDASAAQALSKGFWFKSATVGTLNCAGQVSALSTFTRNVPAGQFEIVANPYPVALGLNAPTSAGFTAGEIGDGSDPTWGNAPMIQVLKENGQSYSYYYYVSDGDDGTMRYDLTGWVDELGNILTGTQVGVGQALWIKSATAGTFTFSL